MKGKNLIFTLLVAALFLLPLPAFWRAEASEKEVLYSKTERVEHLFTHALIAHPDIAFKSGNEYGNHLDEDCLTPEEFQRILEKLHQKDYALVDPTILFEGEGLFARRVNFTFAKGKKPLILSFDDIVYDRKNKGKGMSDRLVVKDNEIYAETDGTLHSNEFLPILENFIKQHPDFSYHNARGIVFLTGFEGILGYRTQAGSQNREDETVKAKELIRLMKEKGWRFGSHTYAHAHMKKQTPSTLQRDVKKWKAEVGSLVGDTPFFAYPYGEWEIEENCQNEKIQILLQDGFSFFFGVGEYPFFSNFPLKSKQAVLFQDRCPMDGIALRKGILNRFFDAREVYDHRRPIPLL